MEKEVCIKCSYSGANNKKFDFFLCDFCYSFSPNGQNLFSEFVKEKIDGKLLEGYRKNFKLRGEPQKKSMISKASKGELMSRAPLGYKIENGKLIPAQNSREVEEIFEEFLNNKISLNQLSKKHNLSINGLKKILKNFTYLGKIKFNNQVHDGNHQSLVSSTLFNHVQNKLEKLGIR